VSDAERVEQERNLLLVRLLWEDGSIAFVVTISRHFAEQHSITNNVMQLEDAPDWFTLPGAMCHVCYSQRWPTLAAEKRRTS
jgi:hypothetical protein